MAEAHGLNTIDVIEGEGWLNVHGLVDLTRQTIQLHPLVHKILVAGHKCQLLLTRATLADPQAVAVAVDLPRPDRPARG